MITVYYLSVDTINSTETVSGSHLIHDSILETTADPLIRKLIMSTTLAEHEALLPLALSFREPTQDELDLFYSLPVISPPSPDILRLQELLSTSPQVITMPHIWEALRLLGKLHGISS